MKTKVHQRDILKAQKEDIPIYMAEQYEDTKLRFWCPHCARYHGHGDENLKPYDLTHRVAHCTRVWDSRSRSYIKEQAHQRGYYLFYPSKAHKPSSFI